MSSPTITIAGNIGTEIKFRSTNNSEVANFRVITNDRRQNENNQWEDYNTTGWNVEVWGRLAKKVTEHLEKGDPVIITGSIYEQQWVGNQGDQMKTMIVKANNVALDVGLAKTK